MYYGAETFEKLTMKNIDQEEVNKFDEIAEKWWDLEGEFKPLHQINPLRVGFINDRTDLKGAKVLDIGCGGGILSESLSNLGAEVIGIDASEKTIGVAKARSNKVGSNITFLQMTLEDYINRNLQNIKINKPLRIAWDTGNGVVGAIIKNIKNRYRVFFI